MRFILAFLFFGVIFQTLNAQVTITPIPKLHANSMRGLYMVNSDVAWASGVGGVILKMQGGAVQGVAYDSLIPYDFRDIHAFSDSVAVIMSSGDGCVIFSTSDGGEKFFKVYENLEKGIFFDGMDFWNDSSGVAFSDPINNKIYLIETNDGGISWSELTPIEIPKTLAGEAGFAASGTSIVCKGDSTVWIGMGSVEKSRILKSINRGKTWEVFDTPMRFGEASGIYSLSFSDELIGVAVGGNYLDSTNTEGNCAVTSDGGETWELVSENPPLGYRSCVANNGEGAWVACGRTGVDASFDNGKSWKHISDEGYYSCVLVGNSGWLTGKSGKIARITIE